MGKGEGLLLIGIVVNLVARSVLKCAAAEFRADPEPYMRGAGENFKHPEREGWYSHNSVRVYGPERDAQGH